MVAKTSAPKPELWAVKAPVATHFTRVDLTVAKEEELEVGLLLSYETKTGFQVFVQLNILLKYLIRSNLHNNDISNRSACDKCDRISNAVL